MFKYIAPMVKRQVKYSIMKQAEKKSYTSTGTLTVNTTQADGVFGMAIAQGDGVSQRNGNWIYVKYFRVRFRIIFSNQDSIRINLLNNTNNNQDVSNVP